MQYATLMLFLRKQEKKFDFFMPLTVLNEPPAGTFAGNVLMEFIPNKI